MKSFELAVRDVPENTRSSPKTGATLFDQFAAVVQKLSAPRPVQKRVTPVAVGSTVSTTSLPEPPVYVMRKGVPLLLARPVPSGRPKKAPVSASLPSLLIMV